MTLATLTTPTLALLDMLGGSELLVIFLLVLVFFGGEKMPEFARGLGKAIREFKKAASGVEQEFKRALEEEPPRPNPPLPTTFPAHAPNTILPPKPAAPPSGPVSTPAPQNIAPAAPPAPAAEPVIPPPPSAAADHEYHPDLPDDHHVG